MWSERKVENMENSSYHLFLVNVIRLEHLGNLIKNERLKRFVIID